MDVAALTPPEVDAFLVARRACYRSLRSAKALEPILSYLRRLGVWPAVTVDSVSAPVDVLVERFHSYLLAGLSYGFRSGRSPHDALDALAVGIERKKVNWVLDSDIRDFWQVRDGLAPFRCHGPVCVGQGLGLTSDVDRNGLSRLAHVVRHEHRTI
jgi:hypothetical protein